MAKLTYFAIASLDGYLADTEGKFDWAVPDEEVHRFINERERQIGTYLYGRRMYETMAAWETLDLAGQPDVVRDFAQLWRAADKVVYSSLLERVCTPRTRLERGFDAQAVRGMKASAQRDISVGGAGLAAHAMAAGLVDEYELILAPTLVGGGTRSLPNGVRLDLVLLEERRFQNGMVYLRYAAR